ncbi:hypothetical protein IJ384_04605 [bacterium]|nr:hypothetical protein [bacterium]
MQVNFNPSVNYSKPSFKARFADDKNTKSSLEHFIYKDGEATLAVQFALEDIPTDDLISIGYNNKTEEYYVQNLSSNKIAPIKSVSSGFAYIPPRRLLIELMLGRSVFDECIPHNVDYYIDKATEYIKEKNSTKLNEINKLEDEIDILRKSLEKKKTELVDRKYEYDRLKLSTIKKEVFSLVKKVK